MNKFKIPFILFALLLSFSLVSAQEPNTEKLDNETELGVEAESEVAGESSANEEAIEEEAVQFNEELSLEEIAELIEDSETLESDDVDELSDLEGEIVGLTETEVILELEDGNIVVVDRDVYENQVSTDGRRVISIGHKIQSGTVVNQENGTYLVNTSKGSYSINDSTPITKNGERVSMKDLKDGDDVVVQVDKDNNVIAVELISDIEEASNMLLIGSIIAILLLIISYLVFRKRA